MMAGGPRARKGVAQHWGGVVTKTESEGTGHGGQASTWRLPLSCFEVMSGQTRQDLGESGAGGRFAERRV